MMRGWGQARERQAASQRRKQEPGQKEDTAPAGLCCQLSAPGPALAAPAPALLELGTDMPEPWDVISRAEARPCMEQAAGTDS